MYTGIYGKLSASPVVQNKQVIGAFYFRIYHKYLFFLIKSIIDLISDFTALVLRAE